MPLMTAETISSFSNLLGPISASLANSCSENVGNMILLDPPTVETQSLDGLMSTADVFLLTTFTLTGVPDDPIMLALNEGDACLWLDAMQGGDGSAAPQEVDDDSLTLLSGVMKGVVQGLGIALGNALQQSITPASCNTALTTISAPEAYMDSPESLLIVFPGTVGSINFQLRLYMTPAVAYALLGETPPEEPSNDESISMEDIANLVAEADANAANAASDFGGAAPSLHEFTAQAGGGFGGFGSAPGGSPTGGLFTPFESMPSTAEVNKSMELIMDIPLDVSVELGRVQMLIKDVLELSTGSIVELERVAGEPVDLMVNGQLIAKGEVVVIEDNFGIRVTEIISPGERMHSVSKR